MTVKIIGETPHFDSALSTDHSVYGITCSLTAAVAVNFGDIGFLDSNGKVALGNANAITTAGCIVMCADSAIAQNASGSWLLHGIAKDNTWTWTVGGLIYLSTTGTTGNTLTQTLPSGTDDVIQIVGVALSTTAIYFKPQLVQVEHI